jgi:hypothetical protein
VIDPNRITKLLSFTKVRDARILKLVIPAQSLPSNALIGGGNPLAVDGRKMDPRFRGDDMSFAKRSLISAILDKLPRNSSVDRRGKLG